jgi:exonuclease III
VISYIKLDCQTGFFKNRSKRVSDSFSLFNGKKCSKSDNKSKLLSVYKVIKVNKKKLIQNASQHIVRNKRVNIFCRVKRDFNKSGHKSRLGASSLSKRLFPITTSSVETSVILKKNIIYLMNVARLLIVQANDVELNPGPEHIIKDNIVSPNNFFICTYNVKGLGNFKKLKRVLNQLNKLPFKNCVINLQETHITNLNTLQYHWKHGSIQSGGTTASAGVATLFNSTYFDDVLDSYSDLEGRICSFTATKNGEVYSFFNIYAPNDHYQSLDFYINLKSKIVSVIDSHPECHIILSGDFNVVMDDKVDSIGRNQTSQEKKVIKIIEEIKILGNISDSYRNLNTYGGFTWGKNNPVFMRSRLDHIFISNKLCKNLISSSTSPFYNESDHSMVITELEFSEIRYGPGIVRINSGLLEDSEIRKRVIQSLNEVCTQMPDDWDPHQILDFYKYSLRKVMLQEGKAKAKSDRSLIEHTNYEMNLITEKLNKVLSDITNESADFEIENLKKQADRLKDALEIASAPLQKLKDEESKKLIFRSRAKWAEEGEKSNKYFMNLLKARQKKMLIRKIISNGNTHYAKNDVEKAIQNFYRDLYRKQDNLKEVDPEIDLFNNLPSLDEDDRKNLNAELTLDEIWNTLKTCEESAPGPDGITYKAYMYTWETSGNIILNAWLHSCRIGKTSQSQREAVITLLEKKGKDCQHIANLRPISLSNCDIKICTKAIALRTNKILHKLVDIAQTGYVPNRQVSDNNRLIEEIIDIANNSNEQYYLITLDAQKAFDSVDHDYLIRILKIYNFPETYINWIKMIYTDLSSKVMVNGYTTESFKILQSVKQGDALSCALFILAIEPLLRKINLNDEIIPVTITHNEDGTVKEINVKTIAYADDITCVVKDVKSIQLVINEYENFSAYSGIKLNVAKTEIMILGSKSDAHQLFNIEHNGNIISIADQKSVCICGITYSNDKSYAYKKNIDEKILKLERQLIIWRQRNLTLEGKILIVKTFGLSQLIYSLQSTLISPKDIKLVESIIFSFIWNIKKGNPVVGKINRNLMMECKQNGGLKAPNVNSLVDRILIKNFIKNSNSSHPISLIQKIKASNLNFEMATLQCTGSSNCYIGNGMRAMIGMRKNIDNDINVLVGQNDGIHKNYYAFIQNQELAKLDCFNIHQQFLINRLKVNNINTVKNLVDERSNNRFPHLFLDVFQLYSTIPKTWIKLLRKTNRLHPKVCGEIYVGLNKWKPTKQVQTKDLSVITIKTLEDINETLIVKKFPTIDRTQIVRNPFVKLHKTVKDVKLRNVQYKLLHNIYPTMKHLHKWKIKQSDKCRNCNVTETLAHAIYECNIAKDAISKISEVIKNRYNVLTDLNLTFENMLLGISSTVSNSELTFKNKAGIDTILILLKQKLILQREEKRILDEGEIEKIVDDRIALELYNMKKYNKKQVLCGKWGQ